MSKVTYSKSRILSQAGATNFTSKKIAVGTVLTIQDVSKSEYPDRNGNPVNNDKLILHDSAGSVMTITVKEYMKFKVAKDVERYHSDSDNDDITLPGQITIIKSEDRLDSKGRKRYPTYAYTGAQAFIDSKGALDYIETVIESPLREDNPFDVLQVYTVALK